MENGNPELQGDHRHLQMQPPALHVKQPAVCVRSAYKRYGSKKDSAVVLDGLNMTVPKGSIYGLLGASGCGKTTLLSCIVGRKRLNSGKIWVLGGTPGSRGSGVPGPRIGYMPQEVALYPEFTIRETLVFFGWITDVKKQRIEERIDFLLNLLMLPNTKQAVKTLSGGQQRRVSLAAALVHEPELLILDEPTVGVDPLLRKNIWDHLIEIATKNITIIITTHYIDETRQAHLIGLMRGGYFLAEESPGQLLTRFGVETLEQVFFKLSLMQNKGNRPNPATSAKLAADDVDSHSHYIEDVSGDFGDDISTNKQVAVNPSGDTSELPPKEMPPVKFSDYLVNVKGSHMRALIWKYSLWMVRNIPVMLFIIGLPFVQISLFCISIGHDPYYVRVAVVNFETNNTPHCNSPLQCNSTRLSCNYLGYLEKRALYLIYYESEDSARDSVIRGKTYASIVIKHNYSLALRTRVKQWRRSRPWDIEASEIDVFRDISTYSIAQYLKVYLYNSFHTFIQDYLQVCGINRKALSIPISMQSPVYGLTQPNFTDFATPGIILTIIFFLAVALTAGAILAERNEGSLERSLVCGITEIEVLFSYVVCQFMVMVVQSVIVMVCAFVLFGMTERGSLTLVILLTLLTGFSGMCFGFVISCVCDSERMATYMAMGSLLPMMLLSGIIWPVEAMHRFLRLVSFALPLTKATESMRSILQKGWGISKKVVYTGFISTSIWILIFLTISVLFLKFKKG